MKQILIVRINNKLITKNKVKDKVEKDFKNRFPYYDVILDFTENDNVFNGYWFKLELVK